MTPTLLDLYAAAALQGALACPVESHADTPIAERAFDLAEQMLEERAKREGQSVKDVLKKAFEYANEGDDE